FQFTPNSPQTHPGAGGPRLRILANKWRFETRSEPHAGAAVHGPGGKVLAANAADQMDLRVGALPAETAVKGRDSRWQLVAPAVILESLRGKIERPSAICVALSVRVYNHRYCPPCRSQKNMVFDQLAHASIARSV